MTKGKKPKKREVKRVKKPKKKREPQKDVWPADEKGGWPFVIAGSTA